MQTINILSQDKCVCVTVTLHAVLKEFSDGLMTLVDLFAIHEPVKVMVSLPRCHWVLIEEFFRRKF